MKRRLCSSAPQSLYSRDLCDVSYETICTTIIATKYVKVSVWLGEGGEGQDAIASPPYQAVLI